MNTELLKAKIKEKYGTQTAFADASGLDVTTINKYACGKCNPSKPNLKLMSMMLGVSEKELENVPKTVQSASNIIENESLKSEIGNLKTEMQALRNDLSMMAKVLIEINKTTHESQAQCQLNHEEISAVFAKVGEINGTVTKLYAHKKKGY